MENQKENVEQSGVPLGRGEEERLRELGMPERKKALKGGGRDWVLGCGEWIPTEPSHIGWKGKGIHPAQRINIGCASPVLSSCEHGENLVFFPDYSQEC